MEVDDGMNIGAMLVDALMHQPLRRRAMHTTCDSGFVDPDQVTWVHLVIRDCRGSDHETVVGSDACVARGAAVDSGSLSIKKDPNKGLFLTYVSRHVPDHTGHF